LLLSEKPVLVALLHVQLELSEQLLVKLSLVHANHVELASSLTWVLLLVVLTALLELSRLTIRFVACALPTRIMMEFNTNAKFAKPELKERLTELVANHVKKESIQLLVDLALKLFQMDILRDQVPTWVNLFNVKLVLNQTATKLLVTPVLLKMVPNNTLSQEVPVPLPFLLVTSKELMGTLENSSNVKPERKPTLKEQAVQLVLLTLSHQLEKFVLQLVQVLSNKVLPMISRNVLNVLLVQSNWLILQMKRLAPSVTTALLVLIRK